MSDTLDTTVNLGHYFSGFVKRQIAAGRYKSESEVVAAGLRLLEESEAKLQALRAALIEGEQSGPAMPFDIEQFLEEKRIEHDSRR